MPSPDNITSITPANFYKLRIEQLSGKVTFIDISDDLHGEFEGLRDLEAFDEVFNDGGDAMWPTGQSISQPILVGRIQQIC